MKRKKQSGKTKNGLVIDDEAKKMADVFIAHYGIDNAEKIAQLLLEKITAKRKAMRNGT